MADYQTKNRNNPQRAGRWHRRTNDKVRARNGCRQWHLFSSLSGTARGEGEQKHPTVTRRVYIVAIIW